MKTISDPIPRTLAKWGPTVDNFRQNGHRASVLAKVLNIKDSVQCPHITRHMPGDEWVIWGIEEGGKPPGPFRPGIELGTPSESGFSERVMTRLQFCLGQAIRAADALQINKQLQLHRTYFLPVGGSRIGYKITTNKYGKMIQMNHTFHYTK